MQIIKNFITGSVGAQVNSIHLQCYWPAGCWLKLLAEDKKERDSGDTKSGTMTDKEENEARYIFVCAGNQAEKK